MSQRIRGVSENRIGDTFETFDLKRNPTMAGAYNRCKAVGESKAWCALLAGTTGNGKTHLAIAAMNEFGLGKAYFWKVPDFLKWIREMHFDRGFRETEILRDYQENDFLLVFDDLGVEKQTEWAEEQLYGVLDARSDARLPTIITSNVDVAKIDQRIKSRYSPGLVICTAPDLRAAVDHA